MGLVLDGTKTSESPAQGNDAIAGVCTLITVEGSRQRQTPLRALPVSWLSLSNPMGISEQICEAPWGRLQHVPNLPAHSAADAPSSREIGA